MKNPYSAEESKKLRIDVIEAMNSVLEAHAIAGDPRSWIVIADYFRVGCEKFAKAGYEGIN